MKKSMLKLFWGGIFSTGWMNAAISLLLVLTVYLTSQIDAVLNHGPAVLDLKTAWGAALPVIPIFVIPSDSL